jgi:hypothetical protein
MYYFIHWSYNIESKAFIYQLQMTNKSTTQDPIQFMLNQMMFWLYTHIRR